jgi:hypothetical protein
MPKQSERSLVLSLINNFHIKNIRCKCVIGSDERNSTPHIFLLYPVRKILIDWFIRKYEKNVIVVCCRKEKQSLFLLSHFNNLYASCGDPVHNK